MGDTILIDGANIGIISEKVSNGKGRNGGRKRKKCRALQSCAALKEKSMKKVCGPLREMN
jgi:hypothetical protein